MDGSSTLPPIPSSPGVGMRRKGPKTLPRLPLSAFSPPNSGTSERFPLPASPSTLHPSAIIDANVVVSGDDLSLSDWRKELTQVTQSQVNGAVVSLEGSDSKEALVSRLSGDKAANTVSSVIVPLNLDAPAPETAPAFWSSSSIPVSLTTVYTRPSPVAGETLKWALQQGRPVDIDVQVSLTNDTFEAFEDLLTRATDIDSVPPIIIKNLLPPPDELDLPIVKLMNHPSYLAYQAQTAALSLYPTLHIKFLPPTWNAPTPKSPPPGVTSTEQDVKQNKEWKRRIKMYLSPVLEAFGFERIIFGSSPSSSSTSASRVPDWYELARESFAELGVEQEAIDAVFGKNAQKVYKL
ncbi:hypothetical protein HGRIS_002638 [Hohenbuehelia grisea]|uniref:Amidohydrolase-related domain-containing protein n=1 Tax=Hohenbuehelia grisea TaxID=104357 RepID=A0ABR3JL21_9AGAR